MSLEGSFKPGQHKLRASTLQGMLDVCRRLGNEVLDGNAANLEEMWIGVVHIPTSGDYTDNRYFVRRAYQLNNSGNETAVVEYAAYASGHEFYQEVTATNFLEMSGNHRLRDYALVVVYASTDEQSPPVKRFFFWRIPRMRIPVRIASNDGGGAYTVTEQLWMNSEWVGAGLSVTAYAMTLRSDLAISTVVIIENMEGAGFWFFDDTIIAKSAPFTPRSSSQIDIQFDANGLCQGWYSQDDVWFSPWNLPDPYL